MVLAHNIDDGSRTLDVQISEDVSFNTMLLKGNTLKGLRLSGFLKPSPVQLYGIPLGKCGFDLLLEAKSGTGKTGVFAVIALEQLDLNKGIQTIIIAPTREIAYQVCEVIKQLGSCYTGLRVEVVIGGMPLKDDIEKLQTGVHILVGSPGRLRHLIQDKYIEVSSVRLVVLDEADKLMEKSFIADVNYIFSVLPKQKQVIMSSATYPEGSKSFINKYVQNVQLVCPDTNNILIGIEQKVTVVPFNSNNIRQTKNRYDELKKILSQTQFKQCLIFCNYQARVGEVHKMLTRDKWPADQLYGQQEQTDRLDALRTLQDYKCRILVTTDLTARGIDASNVDIVINFEPPFEWQTYLHRIGRAGRYGSYGVAISILSEGNEENKFREMLVKMNLPIKLHMMWTDEPFSETGDVITSQKILTCHALNKDQNDNENGTELWQFLTDSSINNQVSDFKDLCSSFECSKENAVETFTDLIKSFETDNNYENDISYRHLDFFKLSIPPSVSKLQMRNNDPEVENLAQNECSNEFSDSDKDNLNIIKDKKRENKIEHKVKLNMDQTNLDEQAGNFEEQADDVEEHADDVEEQAEDVEEQADDVEEQADDVEEQADDVEEQADDVEEQADDVEEQTDDVEEQADELEEQADDVEEQADDVEEQADDLDKKAINSDKQSDNLNELVVNMDMTNLNEPADLEALPTEFSSTKFKRAQYKQKPVKRNVSNKKSNQYYMFGPWTPVNSENENMECANKEKDLKDTKGVEDPFKEFLTSNVQSNKQKQNIYMQHSQSNQHFEDIDTYQNIAGSSHNVNSKDIVNERSQRFDLWYEQLQTNMKYIEYSVYLQEIQRLY